MFPSTGAAKHVMVQLLSRVAHLEVSEDNLRLGLIVSLITFCSNITHSRSCRTGVSSASQDSFSLDRVFRDYVDGSVSHSYYSDPFYALCGPSSRNTTLPQGSLREGGGASIGVLGDKLLLLAFMNHDSTLRINLWYVWRL